MNEEHDEQIINQYIKTIQIIYVHVNFQQYDCDGWKNKEKELCCVILKIIILIIIIIILILLIITYINISITL